MSNWTDVSFQDGRIFENVWCFSLMIFSCLVVLHVTFGTMRLRVRKASQQPSATPPARTTKAKRKHSEVEHTRSSGGAAMQKSDTGIFSTIKRFIRGNAVKVCYDCLNHCHLCICIQLICRSPEDGNCIGLLVKIFTRLKSATPFTSGGAVYPC